MLKIQKNQKYQTKKTKSISINLISCPACKQQHTLVSSGGRTLYKSRLGLCDDFKKMTVEDRVDVIAQANGCVLSLDWTGGHHCDACQSIAMGGRPFPSCTILTNGSSCGVNHHGSINHF